MQNNDLTTIRKYLSMAVGIGDLTNNVADEVIKTISIKNSPTLITRKEAALMLKCSTTQIDRYAATGKFKKIYLSERKCLFYKENIEQYIAELGNE